MMAAGVDFFTGGNWTTFRAEIHGWLNDPAQPVIRPANYKEGVPGLGWKAADTPFGKVQIISLLGQIVGAFPADIDNPLNVVDKILEETKDEVYAARIVNFHGDFSSEKLVIGQYLDGRVTAVIGDHWHTPTTDANVLPGGTAHISDVGMVGSKDSCLGIESEIIIERWKSNNPSRNELETDGRMWLCAVLIEVDPTSKMPKSMRQIIEILDA
jgi:2',3'-cyclic-nucleotide 2'-phosphodiesterase